MNWKDKDIQNKLKEREILPSAGLWERLEGEMNQSSYKKSKKLLWMGVAASFLIGLLISNFMLTNKTPIAYKMEEINISPNYVKSPTKRNTIISNEITAKEDTKTVEDWEQSAKNDEYIPTNPEKTEETFKMSNEFAQNEIYIDYDTINELRKQVKNSRDYDVNSEVEKLLSEANSRRKNRTQKEFNSNVSATQLLWSAEQEVGYEKDKTILERSIELAHDRINKTIQDVAGSNNQ